MKGPAIFLAQFAGKKPPFDTLENLARWASSLGYRGIQVPLRFWKVVARICPQTERAKDFLSKILTH